MKAKSGKKLKGASARKMRAKLESASEAVPPLEQTVSSTTVTLSSTDPRVLYELAAQEPDQREMAEYTPVIEMLRNKNFSYREIAEWFSEHGVELDHNTIYRLYTKHLSDQDAALEAQRVDDEERDEAFRNSR